MLGKIEKTGRGFQVIDFKDHTGEKCSLQQSSLADFEPPGTSAVWLGINDYRMHLQLEQVKELIKHLQKWVKEGVF